MFKLKMPDFDIEKIADSGQCFRINKLPADGALERWQIVACDKLAYATREPFNGSTTIECKNEDNMFWAYYFDLNTNYERFRNSVDPNDLFLSAAVDYGVGIRILRQNPWEMLVTYLISQRRSIPSIKTCIERISKRWGDEIAEGVFAFPTAAQLSKASIEDLNECGLGYRSEYVFLAAQGVVNGTIDLMAYDNYSDEELFDALCSLRGVGPKVANCVSLFGYYRVGAFPVDVWIDRVQQQFYMGRFPIELYPGYAGIMQQYIFYYIRSLK